eukprot:4852364-Pleurochrysis_carterae.AAC.1
MPGQILSERQKGGLQVGHDLVGQTSRASLPSTAKVSMATKYVGAFDVSNATCIARLITLLCLRAKSVFMPYLFVLFCEQLAHSLSQICLSWPLRAGSRSAIQIWYGRVKTSA